MISHRVLKISVLLIFPVILAMSQVTAPHKKGDSTQAAGKPFSFDRLAKGVDGIRARVFTQQALINRIKEFGLAFRPTPEDLEKLKELGASPKLLSAIESASQPPVREIVATPPPPPPVVREGLLAVTCTPVDCAVFVGAKRIDMTSRGHLEGIKLPVGTATVAVAADGYEADPKTKLLTITENGLTSIDFKLKPTQRTLEKAGGELFQRMVDALGGKEGLKETGFVRARGTALVYDRGGKPVAWSLAMLIKDRDKAKFSVTRDGQKYNVAFTDEGYRWSKTPKCEEVQGLEDVLRLVREYQIGAVIDRLGKGQISLVAERVPPGSGEAVVLRSDGSPNSYVITLESEFRPKEIRLESSGLGAGLKILFSDYVKQGKSFYPKVTQIVLPDESEIFPVTLKTHADHSSHREPFRGDRDRARHRDRHGRRANGALRAGSRTVGYGSRREHRRDRRTG